MNYYPLPCHNLSRCRQDQIQKIATTKTWEKGTNFSVLGVSRDEWSVNSITFAYSTKKTVATSARRQQQQQQRLLLTKKVIGSQLLLTIPHFADPPCHPRPSPYLQIKNKKKKNHHRDSGCCQSAQEGGGDLPRFASELYWYCQ